MKKPKTQDVYAEIYSYGISDRVVRLGTLEKARKSLEEHIEAMQKVGDYEIFRNEVADGIQMRDGDMSITLYIPSENEDEGDNDVEYVIIRPKKGEAK